jgi:hypothetical protein
MYHDSKNKPKRVYHKYPDCPAGVRIEICHLRAGEGSGRDLCKKCARRATT